MMLLDLKVCDGVVVDLAGNSFMSTPPPPSNGKYINIDNKYTIASGSPVLGNILVANENWTIGYDVMITKSLIGGWQSVLVDDGYNYSAQLTDSASSAPGFRINNTSYNIKGKENLVVNRLSKVRLINDTSKLSLYINGTLNDQIASKDFVFNTLNIGYNYTGKQGFDYALFKRIFIAKDILISNYNVLYIGENKNVNKIIKK